MAKILSHAGFAEITLIVILLGFLAISLCGESHMDYEKASYFLLTVGCFGITIFMLKKWINEVGDKLSELDNKLTNLLVSLPKEYADKAETRKSVTDLWARIDQHSIAIAKIEGKDGRA